MPNLLRRYWHSSFRRYDTRVNMEVTEYNECISELLDDDFEMYFADETLSYKTIESFPQEIHCDFPEDFKCLVASRLNGFYAEANENVWPRKKGGAHWMFQYGLLVFGLDANLPDWVNLRNEVVDFREHTKTSLTPCMKTISSADPYCFTESGDLVKWDHETFETEKISKSFFEVFTEELRMLKDYKEKAKKELKS